MCLCIVACEEILLFLFLLIAQRPRTFLYIRTIVLSQCCFFLRTKKRNTGFYCREQFVYHVDFIPLENQWSEIFAIGEICKFTKKTSHNIVKIVPWIFDSKIFIEKASAFSVLLKESDHLC